MGHHVGSCRRTGEQHDVCGWGVGGGWRACAIVEVGSTKSNYESSLSKSLILKGETVVEELYRK